MVNGFSNRWVPNYNSGQGLWLGNDIVPNPYYYYNSEVGHWVLDRNDRLFDARNVGNIDFYREARSGRLNRNEFTALQMYQAETERLRAKFLSDGFLDHNERTVLAQRQIELDRLYNTYLQEDYYPRYQVGGYRNGDAMDHIVDLRMMDQYGRIYDGIRSGDLTYREYNILDNNLEGVSRHSGYYLEGVLRHNGWNYNPSYKPSLYPLLDYTNNLLNYYNNNFEREWWGNFVIA